MRLLILAAAVACAVLLGGCGTVRTESFSGEQAKKLVDSRMLVFPAFVPAGTSNTLGLVMGRGFSDRLRQELAENVMFTGDINQLSGQDVWQDMFKNDKLDLKEVSENARTLDCKSAIVIRIISQSGSSPYSVYAEATWINAEDSSIVLCFKQRVSLENTRTKMRFSEMSPPPVKNMLPRTEFERFVYFAGREMAATVTDKALDKSLWESLDIFE